MHPIRFTASRVGIHGALKGAAVLASRARKRLTLFLTLSILHFLLQRGGSRRNGGRIVHLEKYSQKKCDRSDALINRSRRLTRVAASILAMFESGPYSCHLPMAPPNVGGCN